MSRAGDLVKGFRTRTVPRERTALAIWFWEIDRVLLSLIVALMAIGLVAVAAASPVAAIDRSTAQIAVNPLIYFYRQIFFVLLGLPIMLVISMLPRPRLRSPPGPQRTAAPASTGSWVVLPSPTIWTSACRISAMSPMPIRSVKRGICSPTCCAALWRWTIARC